MAKLNPPEVDLEQLIVFGAATGTMPERALSSAMPAKQCSGISRRARKHTVSSMAI